jgi:deoxyribodipyrimidine photolyase
MWFRRDLRLSDNPALLDAAAEEGREALDRYDRINR